MISPLPPFIIFISSGLKAIWSSFMAFFRIHLASPSLKGRVFLSRSIFALSFLMPDSGISALEAMSITSAFLGLTAFSIFLKLTKNFLCWITFESFIFLAASVMISLSFLPNLPSLYIVSRSLGSISLNSFKSVFCRLLLTPMTSLALMPSFFNKFKISIISFIRNIPFV